MIDFPWGAWIWSVPLLYFAASAAAFFATADRAWRTAEAAAVLGLCAAGAHAAVVPPDLPGALMLGLVTFLGWVIVRYSRRYLAGEAGQLRYVRALMFTLTAVSVVALSRHLGVLVIGWIATSLGLHHLLTFYADRPAAVIVAHKKFIASRLAELCLLVALVLIAGEAGTLSLDGIAAHLPQAPSPAWQAAAVLVAIAVILKSAQLPVHGWLIQVMEAPTPVSALLHAGIVNLGGFVLIRLATLMSAVPAAQALLVVAGTLTAVLAGLVMMTRISIKVRLAWSTCAQMGFMLMECGLGLYDLAFLHLIAHSLYKAHAFLVAGETVAETRRHRMLPAVSEAGRLPLKLTAAPVAILVVHQSVVLWHHVMPGIAVPTVAVFIVGLGLAPLMWRASASAPGMLRGAVEVFALAQLYLAWHALSAHVVPAVPAAAWLDGTAVAGLALLYLAQAWLPAHAAGIFYRWAYAGFYLDESFTRLTFRLWPARLPDARRHPSLTTGDFA